MCFQKKIRTLALLLLAISVTTEVLRAEDSKSLKNEISGYKFNNQPLPEQSDPELKLLLTDGNRKSVIWRFKDFNHNSLEISFFFKKPVTLRDIRINYARPQRAYGIKRITLIGFNNNGEQVTLGGIFPNQPYEREKDAPDTSFFAVELDSSQPVVSVNLIIEAASYLSLHNVDFSGVPAIISQSDKKKEETVSDNPFDSLKNKFKGDKLQIIESNFNIDDGTKLLLENKYMLYLIDPGCGGVVNYAYDKYAKINMVKYHSKSTWGGLFTDGFLPGKYDDDNWRNGSYKYEIITNTPDKISVKLWCQGEGGLKNMITFEKIYTLFKDSTVLHVDYSIKLSKDNVVPLRDLAVWIHSGMGKSGTDLSLFYPSKSGTKILELKNQTVFVHDSTGGWSGLITKDEKGVALMSPFRYLSCHTFWGNSADCSTVENRFNAYDIEAGGEFKFNLWVVPFYDIGIPQGINSRMAGSVVVLKDGITLKLKAASDGTYNIKTEIRRLPAGTWQTVFNKAEKMSVTPISISIPNVIKDDGTYETKVSASENSNEIFKMFAPVIRGKESGEFVLNPEEKKLISENKEQKNLDLIFNSMSIPSEHVKWAIPFAPGKPKVIFAGLKKGASREAIELAERFDMDITPIYICNPGTHGAGLYDLRDYYQRLSSEICLNFFKKTFEEKKFDCAVISCDLWKYFSDPLKQDILEKVKEGMGLVLIQPESLPAELSGKFEISKDISIFNGKWVSDKNHPITCGVPFEALPATNAIAYTSSDVIARISGKPLLSAFNYEKGRIAAASWLSGAKDHTEANMKNEGRAFLPNMNFLSAIDAQYDYWEYQLSLLAKMIYWSAKYDSAIEAKDLSVANNANSRVLNLKINNKTGSEKSANAELVFRDKFFQKSAEKVEKLQLKNGENQFSIKIEAPVLNGINFVDLRLTTEKGTEWWGSCCFEIKLPISIADISVGKDIWQKNETLTGKVILNSNPMASGKIAIALIDSYDRVFAYTATDIEGKETSFNLPLKNGEGLTFRITAELLNKNEKIDEARKELLFYGKPDEHKLLITSGWPSVATNNIPRFLTKDYFEVLKKYYGVNSVGKYGNTTNFEITEARKLNMPLIGESQTESAGGKFPIVTDKSKGKYGLTRNPCLSQPGFQEKLEEGSSKDSWCRKLGILTKNGPDEANSITNWDGCFSEHCIKEFRVYLKNIYGNLENLNKSWETDYKSWDEVIAMTSDEVKKRHSLAPWIDHRTFNEWNYARSLNNIAKGIKKLDAQLYYSLSGTQDTNACNSWEWYRLSEALGLIYSYGGEQVVQRRSFEKDYGKKILYLDWIGYSSEYEALCYQIFNDLMNNASGFAIYSGSNFINPDFTMPKAGNDLKNALAQVSNGKAETIINSTYKSTPIAFHYSPASIKINNILNYSYEYGASVAGAKEILTLLNSDYDYIAYKQIEDGKLTCDKYKILYMPMSSGLSEKEVQKIKDYVNNGGIIIADFIAGIFDEHGKNLDKSALDEVFGIRHLNSKIMKENALLTGKSSDGIIDASNLRIDIRNFETGIECTTGKALAEVSQKDKKHPGLIVNKYGKGYTVYFASDPLITLNNWKDLVYAPVNEKTVRSLKSIVEALLKKASINTSLNPTIEDGTRLKAAKCYIRENGPALIVGIVRDYKIAGNIDKKTHKVKIALPGEYYSYDLLKGTALGFGNSISVNIGDKDQNVFVLLPYEVNALDVKMNDSFKCGDDVDIEIGIAAKAVSLAKHVFNVEITRPDGKKNEAHSNIYFADNGKCKIKLPGALNDAKGKWEIKITDVMTGIVKKSSYTIN